MARQFLTPVTLPAGSTAPTPSALDNSTKLATTAYVDALPTLASDDSTIIGLTTAGTTTTIITGNVQEKIHGSGLMAQRLFR